MAAQVNQVPGVPARNPEEETGEETARPAPPPSSSGSTSEERSGSSLAGVFAIMGQNSPSFGAPLAGPGDEVGVARVPRKDLTDGGEGGLPSGGGETGGTPFVRDVHQWERELVQNPRTPPPGMDGTGKRELGDYAELAARGTKFALRYISADPGSYKNLSAPEMVDAAKAGVDIGLIYEDRGTPTENGLTAYETGYRSATAAEKRIGEINKGIQAYNQVHGTRVALISPDATIRFALEFQGMDSDQGTQLAGEYYRGVGDYFRKQGLDYKVGAYSSGKVTQYARDAGYVTERWVPTSACGWGDSIRNFLTGKVDMIQITLDGRDYDYRAKDVPPQQLERLRTVYNQHHEGQKISPQWYTLGYVAGMQNQHADNDSRTAALVPPAAVHRNYKPALAGHNSQPGETAPKAANKPKTDHSASAPGLSGKWAS